MDTTRDSSNNVLTGRVVTWSSANTSVASVNSTSGMITARVAGVTQITASSEGATGVATLSVTTTTPVAVASVSVSPASSSLQVGGTAQLSAVTRDANNNVLTGRVVTWSSAHPSVASVDPTSGQFTAVAVGSTTISATSETKTGTAAITVTAPTSGGLWRGNEPAGMASLTDRPFDSLNEPGWGVPVAPGATIVADATAPHSPSNTIHFNYPAGFVGGSGPESSSYTVANYRVLYLAYYFKYSGNWQGHLTGINKHGYVWYGNTPVFVYEVEGVGSGPLTSRMALQTPIVQPNSSGWYTQNLVPSAQFTRGQWALMEIVLIGNTAGTADGALDWYMDGVHVAHYSGIQYTSGTTAFNWVRIAPIWGGITDTVLADQYLAFDHYYISGKQ